MDIHIQHTQRLSLFLPSLRLHINNYQSLNLGHLEPDIELALDTGPDVPPTPPTSPATRFLVETTTVVPPHVKRGNEAGKCASWAHRLRNLFIHGQGDDKVVRRAISKEERLLRPVCDRSRPSGSRTRRNLCGMFRP